MLLLLLKHRHLLLDLVALLAQVRHLRAFRISAALDFLTHLFADPVALGLQAAAFLFEVPLLLGNQLKAGEINGLAPTPQFSGDCIGVVTHKALVEHGSGGGGAGSLWQPDSENLADHHRCHSGEHRDAEGGEGILTLGYCHGGDHAGAEAGHGELGGDVVRALHRGAIGWSDRRESRSPRLHE